MSATLAVAGAVAHLTLQRPEALNALDRATAAALEAAQERLAGDAAVSVVIVSGAGRAFCAGNDVREMPRLGPGEAEALSGRWQRIVDRFAALPQVTIAAVHGYALGGGLMLALAQDIRIAAASARLGLPEVTLGFNPSYGIGRLLDVVGGGPARDLLLTGRQVDAAEALRMGLVTHVVPDDRLAGEAEALADRIAAHPRGGLAATKAVVAAIRAGREGAEALAYAAALRQDPDARARIAAFAARGTAANPSRGANATPGADPPGHARPDPDPMRHPPRMDPPHYPAPGADPMRQPAPPGTEPPRHGTSSAPADP